MKFKLNLNPFLPSINKILPLPWKFSNLLKEKIKKKHIFSMRNDFLKRKKKFLKLQIYSIFSINLCHLVVALK